MTIWKNVYRGGLRVFAVLFALLISTSLVAVPQQKAVAADAGHDLYVFDGEKLVQAPGTEGVKFTSIGSYNFVTKEYQKTFFTGTYRTDYWQWAMLYSCATDTTGQVWMPNDNFDVTAHPDDAQEELITLAHQVSLTAQWSKTSKPCTEQPNVEYEGDTNGGVDMRVTASGPAPYKVHGSSLSISADRNGKLWWTGTPTPVLLPDNDNLTASKVYEAGIVRFNASMVDSITLTTGITVLADKHTTTTGTAIYSAPQSGDPAASIWQRASYMIALLAISVAVGVTVIRKRQNHI